mmetsp:Transcript_1033/g.2932  ORF Transcript_1033/g.2932 Transcript_1033/m.2932 type:complete len:540 (-) Transcript_1033:88-1707(-)
MRFLVPVAALFGGAAAQIGSHQMLAGYQSASDVGPHSMIDLDMEELETKVGEYATNANWITEAMFIYENGGGGLCSQADVDAAMTSDTTPWCTDTTQAFGNSQKSTSIRTLKGFATKNYASDKLTGADGGNYGERMPPIYAGYWNDWAWADSFVTNTYTNVKDNGRAELMKKGANYQAVWMYVLHELEDAIGDCYAGDIYANDGTPTGGAPHAWDEGWAFYAGSQVAATAAGAVTDDGTLIWELAEKRGKGFDTTHSTGPATVNVKLLAKFIEGRDLIIAGKCAEAESLVDPIRAQMTVPLVQGTLNYALKAADPANAISACVVDAGKNAMTASDDCVESWADAWAFAAAVLPQVAECDWGAAETIRYNLDIEAAAPVQGGFYSVKSAIESTYRCLGITCADVGAYPGTMPCSEPDDDDDDDDDDDLLDGGLREVMSLAPMGLAAIGLTFTGISIAAIANAFQEQCALGPTIIFEAGTTHPYYITPNLCTIGAHTYSSKKTVRDASPRTVCRKFCEAASAAGKLALKHVQGLTCYCKRR